MPYGMTYSAAKALMDKARDKSLGKPLSNNTRLYYDKPGDYYYVRLHSTNVVEIHADGTWVLNSGGWETPLTAGRMREYAPNSPYSGGYIVKGAGWVITQPDDPKSPPKVQKCRRCHGVGTTTSPAYLSEFGKLPVVTYTDETDINWPRDPKTGHIDYSADAIRTKRAERHEVGSYGKLPVAIYKPAITSGCYACDATGKRDYGSKPNPIVFYSGIRLNSDGRVIDDNPVRLFENAEKIRERAAKAAKQAKLAEARAKRAWWGQYGLQTAHGSAIVFKAVNSDLVSNHGTSYIPGTTPVADDWATTPDCGQGLHFSPTPSMAAFYHNDDLDVRYLACRVKTRNVVILGNKIKARECRVLHEVDIDGIPVLPMTDVDGRDHI